MKHHLFRCIGFVILVLFIVCPLGAADLKFPVGQDPRFHWGDLKAFQVMDLKGQKVSVFGPWLGPDKDLANSVLGA